MLTAKRTFVFWVMVASQPTDCQHGQGNRYRYLKFDSRGETRVPLKGFFRAIVMVAGGLACSSGPLHY